MSISSPSFLHLFYFLFHLFQARLVFFVEVVSMLFDFLDLVSDRLFDSDEILTCDQLIHFILIVQAHHTEEGDDVCDFTNHVENAQASPFVLHF